MYNKGLIKIHCSNISHHKNAGVQVHDEKELLKAMMVSMEIPEEKFVGIACLIDMGFTATQVATAINVKNTCEVECLMDELTKETIGSLFKDS